MKKGYTIALAGGLAKVPKDYSFDTVTEADYKYKEYVMAD